MNRDPGRPNKPPSKGLIIGIIIGVVILVIIIIVIVVLLLRRKKTSSSSSSTQPGVTCTSDVNCTPPSVCNTATKLCVDCFNDSSCGGNAPRCKVSTNKCVKCLSDGDCPAGATCNSNLCCSNAKPVITSATSVTSANSRIDINFTFSQGLTATSADVVILDPSTDLPIFLSNQCPESPAVNCTTNANCPSGDICDGTTCKILSCFSVPMHTVNPTMTISIYENQFGIHLYPGTSYKVKLKIVYSCGTLNGVSTDYSDPVTVVMEPCGTLTPQNINLAYINGGTNLVVTFPDPGTPSYSVLLEASSVPGVNPSYGVIAGPFTIQDTCPNCNGTAYIDVLNPFPSFNPLYIRARRYGGVGNCSGPVGNEQQVTI